MHTYKAGDCIPTIYGGNNKVLSVEYYQNTDEIRGYWVEFYAWYPPHCDNKLVFISPDEIKFDGIKSK